MSADADISRHIQDVAREKAGEIAAAFRDAPDDFAAHKERLYDLRLYTVREAAKLANAKAGDAFILDLGRDLPAYDTGALYQARMALPALACAVFLGWLLGGLLSTFLGFLGLGGEILRPAAILACIWLEEYLGVNPRARKIMLTVLGLGALGRFAAALASGLVRLGSPGSLRQLIFGGSHAGFFKSIWLWFGALLLLVFFSRKTTGLDTEAFRESLAVQIQERLNFLYLIFARLDSLEEQIGALEAIPGGADSALCPKNDCKLARAVLSLMDTTGPEKRAWLAGILTETGYAPTDADSDYLTWDETAHRTKYDSLGIVRDGDACRILRRPLDAGGRIKKGLVQRLPESGP